MLLVAGVKDVEQISVHLKPCAACSKRGRNTSMLPAGVQPLGWRGCPSVVGTVALAVGPSVSWSFLSSAMVVVLYAAPNNSRITHTTHPPKPITGAVVHVSEELLWELAQDGGAWRWP